MQNKVLIIGNHPIRSNLSLQFQLRGDCVEHVIGIDQLNELSFDIFREVCIMSSMEKSPIDADNEAMEVLEYIAEAYHPEAIGKKRLLCHLLLQSQSLLRLIRLEGFCKNIEAKMEVYPFTLEDQWSQRLAFRLDREPISIQSEKSVHLVIFGMSKVAELTAINAAHVCHFPNYIKNHSLRTRITIIDEKACEKCIEWIQKYQSLFDNSYYRFVDPQKRPAVVNTHIPAHHNMEDFVDIEWEFVSASPCNTVVRNKIKQWAQSSTQLLTIAFAQNNAEQGLNNALHLPDEVTLAGIPVYVYMQNDCAFQQISHSGKVADIRPFGMMNYGYDINLPLVQMAKAVNYIYSQCRVMETNDGTWKIEYAVEVDNENREKIWEMLPFNKRMSSYYNAMTIGVKVRSLNLQADDWNKFYDISQEEIEIIAEVEHNRWNVEELILGWRPCNEEEQREVEADINKKEKLKKRKIHYDIRSYRDLRPDSSGKPVQIYDRCLSACIPLIAKNGIGGVL